VEIDLRNLGLLLPLVKRLAPGLDVRALAAELRERVGEELDYEIEAQNHRTMARAWRDHPFAHVPAVHTALSSRRVLVTELLEGRRFDEVKALDDAARDRFGEIIFRFFFGTLTHLGRASGDPHPGNYLLLDDGRVGFLDFGLMRVVDPGYLAAEHAVARAAAAGDAAAVHRGMATLGYLPDPSAFDADRLLKQLLVGAEWYFEPGERRITPAYVTDLMERSSEFIGDLRRMTLPPQALLIRRMEGLVFQTLGELRASAAWSAIGAEYHAGDPPSTPLGEQDAEFWADRRPLRAAA
jgi:predicted unusual protein kinase regulating ubiquinone biosynthesis (AarF/ABC1/UbiB family)